MAGCYVDQGGNSHLYNTGGFADPCPAATIKGGVAQFDLLGVAQFDLLGMDFMLVHLYTLGIPVQVAKFIMTSVRDSFQGTWEAAWQSWHCWRDFHSLACSEASNITIVSHLFSLFQV